MSIQIEQNIYKHMSKLITNDKLCKVSESEILDNIIASYQGIDCEKSYILTADVRKEMQKSMLMNGGVLSRALNKPSSMYRCHEIGGTSRVVQLYDESNEYVISVFEFKEDKFEVIHDKTSGYINISKFSEQFDVSFKTWRNDFGGNECIRWIDSQYTIEDKNKTTIPAAYRVNEEQTSYSEFRGYYVHPEALLAYASFVNPILGCIMSRHLTSLKIFRSKYLSCKYIKIKKEKIKESRKRVSREQSSEEDAASESESPKRAKRARKSKVNTDESNENKPKRTRKSKKTQQERPIGSEDEKREIEEDSSPAQQEQLVCLERPIGSEENTFADKEEVENVVPSAVNILYSGDDTESIEDGESSFSSDEDDNEKQPSQIMKSESEDSFVFDISMVKSNNIDDELPKEFNEKLTISDQGEEDRIFSDFYENMNLDEVLQKQPLPKRISIEYTD